MADQAQAVSSERKATKHRSPAYPGINLETAIRRAKGFYDKERRNPAPFPVAASHWGFGAKSSGALVTVAALKSFGLMQDMERGPGGRSVKLTELALRIVLDTRPESADRDEAIKTAALHPKMHAELWKNYGPEGWSDANLRHDLIFNWKFNENTVDEFIREYKETVAFAKLTKSDNLSAGAEDKTSDQDEESKGDMQTEVEQPVAGAPTAQRTKRVSTPLLSQTLAVSIPRGLKVEIGVSGDELKRDDLAKIKNQFNRWIEGLEEAFE